MNHSSKILSQTLVQLCLAKGIHHIVIAPGSRNAPLIIGFTSHPTFNNYSIVDERCAAFFGMGMAQQIQKPVVLICTSGSALLNYYPAIAEAYYSHIPLVVISADRPSHLIDIGDGQTIRQENVYQNHIHYSANCKEGADFQEYNEAEINKALNTAFEKSGPVHINAPFLEPLYERVENLTVVPNNIVPESFVDEIDGMEAFVDRWSQASRKMVLVGTLPPNSIEQKWLDRLASDESVVVFTETTSNIHHPSFFPAIDQIITALDIDQFRDLQPEILLTLGGMVVSKRIKAFLRNFPPQEHWHVGPYTALDTFFCLKHHFRSRPQMFFEIFLSKTIPQDSGYLPYWLQVKEYRLQKQQQFEMEMPYSDFSVYGQLFKSIPSNTQLQLANSTAIRYSQLFPMDPSFKVFCNRGTSGIDGSTSTAVGAAVGSKAPTLLITGDLSFFYDSNALWNRFVPSTFRIIVVNNQGGGIFRILPHAKEVSHFEAYFETEHQLRADHLCNMYGWGYQEATTMDALKESLTTFFQPSEKPKLLEVFTPSKINDLVLKDYFKAIS